MAHSSHRFGMMDILCIFFFQAEDGIRDFHVTGVQTCALPISVPCHAGRQAAQAGPADGVAWPTQSSRDHPPEGSGRPTSVDEAAPSETVRIPQEDQRLREIPPTARLAALPLERVALAVGVHSDGYAQRERFSPPGNGHPRVDEDDITRLPEAVVSAAHEIVDRQPVDPTSEADGNALIRPQSIGKPQPPGIDIGHRPRRVARESRCYAAERARADEVGPRDVRKGLPEYLLVSLRLDDDPPRPIPGLNALVRRERHWTGGRVVGAAHRIAPGGCLDTEPERNVSLRMCAGIEEPCTAHDAHVTQAG